MAFLFEMTCFDRLFSRAFPRKNSIHLDYFAVEELAQSKAINCMIAWMDDKQQASQHKRKKPKEYAALFQLSASIFQAFIPNFCLFFLVLETLKIFVSEKTLVIRDSPEAFPILSV